MGLDRGTGMRGTQEGRRAENKASAGERAGRLVVRRQGGGQEKSEWGERIHSTNTVECPQGTKHRGGLSPTKRLVNKVR